MNITVKTLQNETFKVNIDKDKIVSQFKLEIEKIKGPQFNHEQLKLIFSGKILNDDENIPYIEEGQFIVCLVIKKPVINSTTEVTSETSANEETFKNVYKNNQLKAVCEKEMIINDAKESDIQFIISMGFKRAEAELLLEAAGNSVVNAMDFIFDDYSTMGANSLSSTDETEDSNPLDFLKNNPDFQKAKQLIRQNPEYFNDVLQNIQISNPQLFTLVIKNLQHFYNLIWNDEDQGKYDTRIQLTEEDFETIERLKELGFPEHVVVQIYLECNRNEELTILTLLNYTEE